MSVVPPLVKDHWFELLRTAINEFRAQRSGDLLVDSATEGLILKDTQATPHYWRVRVNNAGVLVTTDLGTTKP